MSVSIIVARSVNTKKIRIYEGDKNKFRSDRHLCTISSSVSISTVHKSLSMYYRARHVYDHYIVYAQKVTDDDFVKVLGTVMLKFKKEYSISIAANTKIKYCWETVYVVQGTAHILRTSDPEIMDEQNNSDVFDESDESIEPTIPANIRESTDAVSRPKRKRADIDEEEHIANILEYLTNSIVYLPPSPKKQKN